MSYQLPSGVRHYQTAGFATTRAVYDSLTESDGWTEKSNQGYHWKMRQLPGDDSSLVVHPPTEWDERRNEKR